MTDCSYAPPAAHYLAHFSAAVPTQLCHAELDALLAAAGVEPRVAYARDDSRDNRSSPFVTLTLANDDVAKDTLGRAVCVKFYMQLWTAEGTATVPDAVADVARYCVAASAGRAPPLPQVSDARRSRVIHTVACARA